VTDTERERERERESKFGVKKNVYYDNTEEKACSKEYERFGKKT